MRFEKVCWKELLDHKVEELEDKIIASTLTEEEALVKFSNDYGGVEGIPFTAWGEKYVYFPICYDGAEWVGFAPRNPCDIKMEHQGG